MGSSFHTTLLAVVLAAASASPVEAQPAGWDGHDDLRALADELGHPLRGGERVDLGQMRPEDGVLIVGPQLGLPAAGLGALLNAGARIAVLDDFGTSEPLLRAYQIVRSPAPAATGVRLRDDPELLVTAPASEHPLTEGVGALLTNRAFTLSHAVLRPVFTYVGTEEALVLAGAVGEGRLVAVGDASPLIDQHLALPSHRQFAANLLAYLGAHGGEVWFVGPEQELFGRYGTPHRPSIQRIDAALGKLSRPDLPEWALMLLCAIGIAALLAWALSALPQGTPYLTADALPAPPVWAGFAGRVESAKHDGHNLLWAALDYRAELMPRLAEALEMGLPVTGPMILEASAVAKVAGVKQSELSELLLRLDALATAEQRPDELPHVSPGELSRVVRTGERLLRRLEEERT